jgi:hypothetical protein
MAVAYIMPHIWTPGTLPAAATAPILAALIAEALHAPPKLVRHLTHDRRGRTLEVDDAFEETAVMQVVRGHKQIDGRLLAGAIGLGIAAFMLAALVVTGADFASGANSKLWSRQSPVRAQPTATPAPAPTQDSSTPTATPTFTVTATPTATPTPSPTATPTATEAPTVDPASPTPTATVAPTTTPIPQEGVNTDAITP